MIKTVLGVAIALVAALGGSVLAGDYHISIGDAIGISVVGIPDLTTQSMVDSAGNISVPLVGRVEVGGMTLGEASAAVQQRLAAKTVRHRTDDGREVPIMISPQEVSVTMAEYRPVYVTGDVAKPGAVVYRPGLSVRAAVALAGGFDILHYRLDNPFLEMADLSSQYQTLCLTVLQQSATIARLKAEADGRHDIDLTADSGPIVPPSSESAIVDNERQQLAARDLDYDKETRYLSSADAKEVERAAALREQQGKELQGVSADAADLQRYEDLYKKGAVALPGVSDARRTVLLSSTRALQTTALLASVEREQQDMERRLNRLGDARRMDALKEIGTANLELEASKSKLRAVMEKLKYVGALKSLLVKGEDSLPTLQVTRGPAGKQVQIAAELDSTLEPGDVVDVALQNKPFSAASD